MRTGRGTGNRDIHWKSGKNGWWYITTQKARKKRIPVSGNNCGFPVDVI
jgi:hypothetical protein